MTKLEKYLEAIKSLEDWATVMECAIRVSEMYPELLEEAEIQASNQSRKTNGIGALTAIIAGRISSKSLKNVLVDNSFKPRKVKFVSEDEQNISIEEDIKSDVEPLTRIEKIKSDLSQLTEYEKYRIEEIETVTKSLNKYFSLDLEVDHSYALFNDEKQGYHHPDNLQILTKSHNGKKSKKNWEKFKIEEQVEYIRTLITHQSLIYDKFSIDIEPEILDLLVNRLSKVF